MSKKGLKCLAFVAAIILIAGLGWFANELVGNPVSKMLATNTAKERMAEVYAGTDYYIEEVNFSFKDGKYYAHIKSPSSIDTEFSLCIDGGGKLRWDSYEDRVTNGQNTAYRLAMEYREMVDSVLESPTFPFACDIGYGDLTYISREWETVEDPYSKYAEYALISEDLVLDGMYDVGELGAQAGVLVLYVQDEEVTVERAAEVLLEVRRLMDMCGVPFYAINFVLEYPKPEDGSQWREGRVETMEFLYADIYEEGMVERVSAANDAATRYHAERDAEHEKLMEMLNAQENTAEESNK